MDWWGQSSAILYLLGPSLLVALGAYWAIRKGLMREYRAELYRDRLPLLLNNIEGARCDRLRASMDDTIRTATFVSKRDLRRAEEIAVKIQAALVADREMVAYSRTEDPAKKKERDALLTEAGQLTERYRQWLRSRLLWTPRWPIRHRTSA